MTALSDSLRAARSKIEQGWTQNAWARDADGNEALEESAEAVCWCAHGAMFAVIYNGACDWDLAREMRQLFTQATGDPLLTTWNDAPERTQAEVLAAFDKAIEIAEAEQ